MGTINRLHRFHSYLTRSLGCTPSSQNHCKPIYPHVIIQMFSCESHDGMLTSLISFAFASIAFFDHSLWHCGRVCTQNCLHSFSVCRILFCSLHKRLHFNTLIFGYGCIGCTTIAVQRTI